MNILATVQGVFKGLLLFMMPAFLLGNCTGGCIATKVHTTFCNEFGGTDATPIHHVDGWEETARSKYDERYRRWERNR